MIPADRIITPQLQIARPDGVTYEDLSSFLKEADIKLGDTSQLGTGQTGVDSVVRTCNFTLKNDENNNFAPRDKNSSWNNFDVDSDGTDEYAPLLYPMREVVLRVAIQSPTEQEEGTTQVIKETLQSSGSTQTSFTLAKKPILPGSETVYYGGTPYEDVHAWQDTTAKDETYVIGQDTTVIGDENDGAEKLINMMFDTDEYVAPYTINEDTGEIFFEDDIGTSIEVSYAYFYDLFAGYLGDSIDTDPQGGTVICEARDYAKRLQFSYIDETVDGEPKKYGDPNGILAVDVMQNIIDDNVDTNPPTIYDPDELPLAVKEDTYNYKSVWDAIQGIITQSGWFLGYLYDDDANEWRLKILQPPRDKDTADFDLTALDDIYTHNLELSDDDIRNKITVNYRDVDSGKRESVPVSDSTSIDAFGERPAEIEESDTSQIDTYGEANELANYILEDLKDLPTRTNVNIPLLPQMDLFSTFNATDDRVSTDPQFYAVQSVRHRISIGDGNENSKFRTIVQADGKVKGGLQKWLKMQTRPGASKPVEGRNVINKNADIIVAAHDTPFARRKLADYICSGENDQTIINNVISNLTTEGKILFLDGTYKVNGEIPLNVPNISVIGQSNNTKFIPQSDYTYVFDIDNTGIKIKNINIDCNNHSTSGISFANYSAEVKDCRIENSSDGGIVGTTVDGIISRNYVINNSSGIDITADSSEIRDNIVKNTGEGGDGIEITEYDIGQNNIIDNIAINNNFIGIRLFNCSNSIVSNNHVAYNGYHGISLYGSKNVKVNNNHIVGNNQGNNQYTANILLNPNCDYNNIQGNTCRVGDETNKPQYGIWIRKSDTDQPDSNLVTNNDLYNSGTTQNFLDEGINTKTTAGNRT